jgi:hypothetical protein
MPDDEGPGVGAIIRKRWRGWLRAIHRDIGYLAVGFTLIYALSGIAINHIKDWDPNFHATERTLTIAPIPADASDAAAVKLVTDATGTGAPDDVFRAGDEIRLGYSDGTQVTAIGDTGQVTVQARSSRFFLRIANWLHYNRGKKAWTYVADIYAVMLLYLAISGIFMIKGKLGLRWRGTLLIGLGIAVPIAYVVLSGGPNANNAKVADSAPADKPAVEPPPPERMTPREAPPADDEFARPKPRVQPPPASDPDRELLQPGTPGGSAAPPRAQPPAGDGRARPKPRAGSDVEPELMLPGQLRPRGSAAP